MFLVFTYTRAAFEKCEYYIIVFNTVTTAVRLPDNNETNINKL